MKLIALLLGLVLGLASSASATAPTFGSSAEGGTIVASSFTMSLSYSGYAFVMTASNDNTDATSVTDNGGSTFVKVLSLSTGSSHKLNIWTNFAD